MANFNSTKMARGDQAIYKPGETITVTTSYVTTSTVSAADTISIAKIPHGATITEAVVSGKTVDGQYVLTLGYSGAAAVVGTVTISATYGRIVSPANPYKLSVSDDATNRYATLIATVDTAVSTTPSASLVFTISYVMKPNNS